mmetsp:Transcript_11820/g.33721  ORF Transcript_11820/g.33721 Transcript_11820/m.33721 type:complete len:141 (+) Transcript_11820:413-835(+)
MLAVLLFKGKFTFHKTSVEMDPILGKRIKDEGGRISPNGNYLIPYILPSKIEDIRKEIEIVSQEIIPAIPESIILGDSISESIIFSNLSSLRTKWQKRVVAKQTIDSLFELGFNVDRSNYIAVDILTEPALSHIKALYQG